MTPSEPTQGFETVAPCGLVARADTRQGPRTACDARSAVGCRNFIRCLEGCENAIQMAAVEPGVPAWKRVLDIGCVLLAAPAWLPLMLFVSLFVKLTSSGSIFFRQDRVGFRGRTFRCFKFRTMKAGADSGVHQEHLKQLIASGRPMTKMDALGDSRLIWGGRFLRSSGLDELPQLINVLRGDMSLVGPRPCIRFEYEHYEAWQRRRFDVLPGLTGLGQVSGKNRTTFRQMILLDLYYAMHASPWMDVKIMLKTVGVLAGQVDETRTPGRASTTAFPSGAPTPRASLDTAFVRNP